MVGVTAPTIVVVGDRDQVEHEASLREAFARFPPQTTFRVLEGVGHLLPLEAPQAIADACASTLDNLRAESNGLRKRRIIG